MNEQELRNTIREYLEFMLSEQDLETNLFSPAEEKFLAKFVELESTSLGIYFHKVLSRNNKIVYHYSFIYDGTVDVITNIKKQCNVINRVIEKTEKYTLCILCDYLIRHTHLYRENIDNPINIVDTIAIIVHFLIDSNISSLAIIHDSLHSHDHHRPGLHIDINPHTNVNPDNDPVGIHP